jgi:hypothetical protein
MLEAFGIAANDCSYASTLHVCAEGKYTECLRCCNIESVAQSGADRFEERIVHMLMPGLPTLPQHDYDLANVLFPEKHGKFLVGRRMYHERFMQKPNVTKRFLIEQMIQLSLLC